MPLQPNNPTFIRSAVLPEYFGRKKRVKEYEIMSKFWEVNEVITQKSNRKKAMILYLSDICCPPWWAFCVPVAVLRYSGSEPPDHELQQKKN